MRKSLATFAVFSLFAGLQSATTGAAPELRPTSRPAARVELEVHAGEPLDAGETECPNCRYAAYGTQVKLSFERPQDDLLRIDEAASRLEKVSDELGSDLLSVIQKDKTRNWPCDRESSPIPAPDFSKREAEFWFPGVPAEQAKTLTVDATAVLLCGFDKKSSDPIPIQMPADPSGSTMATVRVGDLDLGISVSTAKGEDTRISLSAPDLVRVAELQAFDSDGHSVQLGPGTTSFTRHSISPGSGPSVRRYTEVTGFDLAKTSSRPASLKVVYFNQVQSVNVPVHADVALKPFPDGPMAGKMRLGPFNLELELHYNRVALRDAGLAPKVVMAQVQNQLEKLDSVSVYDLQELEIQCPGGTKVRLGALVKSFDVSFRRRPPPA